MKLHTKIVLGLFLGAASGIAVNALARDAAWTRWVGENIAGPAGHDHRRLLHQLEQRDPPDEHGRCPG
jgi:hypothetical protein